MTENSPGFLNFDTRFETGEIDLKNKSQELIQQGFQAWPEGVSLTRIKFNTDDGKFHTVDAKSPEQATQEVLAEAEKLSGGKWEAKTIVETFQQNQKRAHIFLRQIK